MLPRRHFARNVAITDFFDSAARNTAAASRSVLHVSPHCRGVLCRFTWPFSALCGFVRSMNTDTSIPCTLSFSAWKKRGEKKTPEGLTPLRTPLKPRPAFFPCRSVLPRGYRRPPPEIGSTTGHLRPLLGHVSWWDGFWRDTAALRSFLEEKSGFLRVNTE